MKIDSLLPEIQRNLARLKALVHQGVDVKNLGTFSLSEQHRFVAVPALSFRTKFPSLMSSLGITPISLLRRRRQQTQMV
jgi:hypothetical protein